MEYALQLCRVPAASRQAKRRLWRSRLSSKSEREGICSETTDRLARFHSPRSPAGLVLTSHLLICPLLRWGPAYTRSSTLTLTSARRNAHVYKGIVRTQAIARARFRRCRFCSEKSQRRSKPRQWHANATEMPPQGRVKGIRLSSGLGLRIVVVGQFDRPRSISTGRPASRPVEFAGGWSQKSGPGFGQGFGSGLERDLWG
jgi:hypothetical protein